MNLKVNEEKRIALCFTAKTFRLSLVIGKYRRIFSNWGWGGPGWKEKAMAWHDLILEDTWQSATPESVSLPRREMMTAWTKNTSTAKEDSRIDQRDVQELEIAIEIINNEIWEESGRHHIFVFQYFYFHLQILPLTLWPLWKKMLTK